MAGRFEVKDKTDREVLNRIAAMLLALAVLAEGLRVLPRVVRGLVLFILRPAEAAAREFVMAEAFGAPLLPAPVVFGEASDSAEAALRLAACFRALASALDGLLAGRHDWTTLPAGHAAINVARGAPTNVRGDRGWHAPCAIGLCVAGRIDSS